MNKHQSGKIPVGISACLLGEEVRFNGGHKQHSYIQKTLGEYFEFRTFCPAVDIGSDVMSRSPALTLKTILWTTHSDWLIVLRRRSAGWRACVVSS